MRFALLRKGQGNIWEHVRGVEVGGGDPYDDVVLSDEQLAEAIREVAGGAGVYVLVPLAAWRMFEAEARVTVRAVPTDTAEHGVEADPLGGASMEELEGMVRPRR